jgi:hypothetical protein
LEAAIGSIQTVGKSREDNGNFKCELHDALDDDMLDDLIEVEIPEKEKVDSTSDKK